MQWLKQSTAASVMLGPAVDDSDGYTPETGLTIAQADLRLTKNGGVFAQKNDATSASHAEFGWYNVELDATDTGTVGRLLLAASATGALPMWREFMVVPANTYDSLVGGTDNLNAEVATMAASSITASAFDAGAVDAAAIAADAIGAAEIADGAIDAGSIAASALTSAKFATDAIVPDIVAASTITACTFGAGAVDVTAIAASAITSSEIAATGADKVADHVIRRSASAARASGDGDPAHFRSLLGAMSKQHNKISITGGTLTVTEEDDSTSFGTQTVGTDSGADPITSLDTD